MAELTRPDAPVRNSGHETSDVSIGGILAFAGGLVVVGLVLHVVLLWMFDYFAAREATIKRTVSSMASSDRGQLPPEPRLEGLESAAVAGQATPSPEPAQQGYAWVDRKTGVVRIPVQTAMKVLADRLPSRPEAKAKDGSAKGWQDNDELPSRSNSGRARRGGQP